MGEALLIYQALAHLMTVLEEAFFPSYPQQKEGG